MQHDAVTERQSLKNDNRRNILSYIINVIIVCNELYEAWEKSYIFYEETAVMGSNPLTAAYELADISLAVAWS